MTSLRIEQTGVIYHTADEELQRLFDEAEKKCLGNLKRFGNETVLVEGGGYEKLWLETQPMGGEMYAKRNMEAALSNQTFFMRFQREDGRMPGSIRCLRDGSVEAQFDKFQGFCFPRPALNMFFLTGRDRDYLYRLKTCLEKMDGYLWRIRDSDGDGLLESWCVYDTGEDNALRYGNAPCYCTADVPPDGCDVVPMASMDFMSYSYACRETLAVISRTLGDGREKEYLGLASGVAAAIRKKLWDDVRGACFDRDKNGKRQRTLVHNNLRCMYWGSFSKNMADIFVRRHLLNPDEFMTPMPLPSVAANDPLFRNTPENNWNGQCEGLTYQRAVTALERYGYYPLVTFIGKKLLDAVIRGGYVFTQQFDPFTGKPSRVGMISHLAVDEDSGESFQDSYGPTLLSVLEYMAHIWGIHMEMGQVWFSLGSSKAPYTYTQRLGDREYTVSGDGKHAEAVFDGKSLGRFDCGVRLITDENGTLLRTVRIE